MPPRATPETTPPITHEAEQIHTIETDEDEPPNHQHPHRGHQPDPHEEERHPVQHEEITMLRHNGEPLHQWELCECTLCIERNERCQCPQCSDTRNF
jgi:hypothetical protein